MAARKPSQSGYYVRPSAAVERGGGFYVPGLEGTRLRLGIGVVLSAALVANRVFSPNEVASSQTVSELLGGVSCALLFISVADEQASERAAQEEAAREMATARLQERQEVSPSLAEAAADRSLWVANTVLRATPASLVMLVDTAPGAAGEVLLRCGRAPKQSAALRAEALLDKLGEGESEYLRVVDESLALPPNIAAAVLQRCGSDAVLVAASERAAFSDKQRLWISELAAWLGKEL